MTIERQKKTASLSKTLKMKNLYFLPFISILIFQSCIGDDFIEDQVEPILRITNPIDTISFEDSFQFEAKYFNEIGQEELVDIIWSSSSPETISIDENGLATALGEGQSTIIAQYDNEGTLLEDTTLLEVGENTAVEFGSATGIIETTTFYTLEGDFEIRENESGLILDIFDNYEASSNLPGLYVYLSNNRNSISDAMEISKVTVFEGAHNYEIEGARLTDYQFLVYFCKPFNVKVGDAEF